MKIFKQFFAELKEYLLQWFSAERELWLARVAGFVSFILIFVFLIFVWKDHQPSLIKNLPKTINRLIRYLLVVHYKKVIHNTKKKSYIVLNTNLIHYE